MASPPRLPWIDHLRTLVILLVVNMHACVTYSNIGSWYVNSDRELSHADQIIFILWQGHLQSFFMGLLFFISGYFAFGSLSRRGPGAFVRERLFRLGAPTLFYMLVIQPFIIFGINAAHYDLPTFPSYYFRYIATGRFLGSSGPMWFALALLVFCLLLAARQMVRPEAGIPGVSASAALPSARTLWIFAIGLGVASFAVRLVQPLGTSVLNMQLCYFSQYIGAFIAGLGASRLGWLLGLARSTLAMRAGWCGLACGPVVLFAILALGSKQGLAPFRGGWHWQALALAMWEQLTGVALSLGLLALFSSRMNREGPWLRWLSDRSFGVYVLHAPVIIALYLLFRPLPWNPLALALLLTVTGLTATFLLADLARRTPGLRTFL
jgi:peptidoglycan/LPS O-acetylase OafA/YrhL